MIGSHLELGWGVGGGREWRGKEGKERGVVYTVYRGRKVAPSRMLEPIILG